MEENRSGFAGTLEPKANFRNLNYELFGV